MILYRIKISQSLTSVFQSIILVVIFFFLGVNTLFPYPLDKAFMGLMVLLLFFFQWKFNKISILIFLLITIFFFISFITNLQNASFIIFFPMLGIIFSLLVCRIPDLLEKLFYGTFLHIIVGLLFLVSSYIEGINKYVHPLYDKGLPFLNAPEGFTTTVQTFATLCVLCLLILYYWRDQGKKINYFYLVLINLTIILTFNRNYLLVLLLIYFFKERKLFLIITLFAVAVYIINFDFFNSLIMNKSTLTSRGKLLEAFQIAFFQKANILQYMLGHGNNQVDQYIAILTYYKTGYIENGLSVLVYTYGFIGFLIYIIAVVIFAFKIYKKLGLFYGFIFGYIFLIAQQFTHEFFSTTLYLLLSFFVFIVVKTPIYEKKNYCFSSIK